MVKWGFSTIGCPDWDLKTAAAFGEKSGYPLLEVRVTGSDHTEKDFLRKLGEEKRCLILGTSFGVTTDGDQYRDMLKACATLAAECSIPYVRIFGGCGFSEPFDDEKKANAKRNLEYFDSLGLPTRLILETHDLFSSGKRVCELFESTGRTLPVIWDTYHTYFTGKESLSESWELLESYIIDVHIKDGNGKELCLPGEGIFPMTELFALLKEKNYAGLMTCEHEKMWHPELPDMPEAFRAIDKFKGAL